MGIPPNSLANTIQTSMAEYAHNDETSLLCYILNIVTRVYII